MNNNHEKNHCGWWCCEDSKQGVSGFGVFLLIIGGFFLAQELGWIATGISLWPIFLIALGLYFIARK